MGRFRRVQWAVQWAVVAIPVLILVVMGWRTRWMSDDGFIHLRVVEQILDGNGPVFNAGERIEASTSPLWVGLLVLVSPLPGLALPWNAVVLGIGLSALGLLAAQRAAVWLAAGAGEGDGPGRRLVVPIGALVVVALRPFWEFASSGLETGLVFAWLGLSMWWCARRVQPDAAPSRLADTAGAALVGLGCLIRPDLALFSLAFAVVVGAAVWPRGWWRRLEWLGAWAAAPVLYQLFRMGYYAMVVPNTALAKEAGMAQWDQGRRYLDDLIEPYALWLPLALLAAVVVTQLAGDLRREDTLRAAARLAPVIASVCHGLYVLRAGGDFMHARLLLPAVFGLAAPVGVSLRWPAAWGRSALRLAAAGAVTSAVVAWAVVCGTGLRRDRYRTMPDGFVVPVSSDWRIMDEREFSVRAWGIDEAVRPDELVEPAEPGVAMLSPPGRTEVRRALPAGFPLASAHAAEAVGRPSYAWGSDVYVMDYGSLGSPLGSHLDGLIGGRPGHQKPVPLVWVLADLGLTDGGGVVDDDQLRQARAALGCGAMRRYLDDIRQPLTPGRFLANIADSVANSTLRLSRRPGEAHADLCGKPKGAGV